MEDVTLIIDFQLSITDTVMARQLIANSLDEIIAEAINGGVINAGNDTEILSYQVIVDE